MEILMGMVKKNIWEKALKNLRSKSFLSSFECARDILGKMAVERETEMAFTKSEDKLFATLYTEMLPMARVEAMAVRTMVLNCPAPRPNDLGTISFNVFNMPGCCRLKLNL